MQEYNLIDSSIRAIAVLKQGAILRLASGYVLFKMNEASQVLIWTPNFTTRVSQADFLELYGNGPFVLVEAREGIDEKKDDAYYAWRRTHQ
jgi:hypothetical protein